MRSRGYPSRRASRCSAWRRSGCWGGVEVIHITFDERQEMQTTLTRRPSSDPIASRRGRRRVLALAACAAIGSGGPVFGITHTYIGAPGHDWNTSSFWSPTGVPTTGDEALFQPAALGSFSFD